MLKLYYQILTQKIPGQIDELNFLQLHTDWFLDQYNMSISDEDGGLVTQTPIVYIEFLPIEWKTLPNNIQRGLLRFNLHLVTDSVYIDKRNFLSDDLSGVTNNFHLDISDYIFKALMNKRADTTMLPAHLQPATSGVLMESMIRVNTVPPRMIGNLMVSVDTWQSMVTDYTAIKPTETVEAELEINCEPLIP